MTRPRSTLAMVLLVLFCSVAALSCQGKTTCRDYGSAAGGMGEDLSIGYCSDKLDREITCQRPAAESPMLCRCVKGGTVGKSFERTEHLPLPQDKDTLHRVINPACGWNLGS